MKKESSFDELSKIKQTEWESLEKNKTKKWDSKRTEETLDKTLLKTGIQNDRLKLIKKWKQIKKQSGLLTNWERSRKIQRILGRKSLKIARWTNLSTLEQKMWPDFDQQCWRERATSIDSSKVKKCYKI